MTTRINLDHPAGYICREDGLAGPRSVPIFMYKDKPGTYMLANGTLASDDLARAAGFEIQSDRLEQRMIQRKDEALADVEAEFAKRRDEIEEEVRKEVEDEAANQQLAPDTETPDDKTTTGEIAADGTRTTSTGEPRETATRLMEHEGQGFWKVIDKATGDVIKSGVDKIKAQMILLEV